jgi:hypothetical protein
MPLARFAILWLALASSLIGAPWVTVHALCAAFH